MKPNAASAQSCSERMRMKKTPMIALKSVKTLPATIEATERLVRSSTGPSLWSRLAASEPREPAGMRRFGHPSIDTEAPGAGGGGLVARPVFTVDEEEA